MKQKGEKEKYTNLKSAYIEKDFLKINYKKELRNCRLIKKKY